MSEILPKSGFTIPKDGDPKKTWGDANITGDLDQSNGVGLLPAIDEIIGEMYETPTDILTSDLKLNAKLSTGATGAGEVQILNDTQNIVKSIKSDTITFADGGNSITAEITQGLPVISTGDVGKKVIVNDAEDGYTLVASSTTAGFNDKSAQTLSFNNATRTLSITPVGDDYKITYDNGKVKSFTSADSIQIADTNGIHGVYYDDTTATLKTFASETRSEIYDNILNDIVVAYVEWSVTDQEHNIVTEILKDRTMSNKTFVKNFFDKSIYVLEGMTTFSDPSQGGTVTPNAALNASAQVGFTAGVSLFGDGKYAIPARTADFDWSVYYINPLGELRHTVKTDYLFLQDTDLGNTSLRVLYNNNGVPTPASSGDFVWYGIGVINATEDQHKVVSFMGENTFGTISVARSNVDNEKATIENSIKIKQEMTIVYMVLIETKSSFGNATECRIVDLQVTTTESGSISAGGSVVPADLVNGADATYLHMHDSVYRKLTNNTFTGDVNLNGNDIKSASVVNASSVVAGDFNSNFVKSWTKSEVGSGIEAVYSIIQLSTGRVLIGTGTGSDDGDIYYSDDFGVTWIKSEVGSVIEAVFAITQLSTGRVLIGTGSGTGDGDVYYSDDFGVTWIKSEIGSVIEIVYSIIQLSTGRVLIGVGVSSGDGDIYYSDDFGLTWTKSETSSIIEIVYSIAQLSTGRVLIGAGSGTGDGDVYYSDDLGLTWTKSEVGSEIERVYSIIQLSTSRVLIGTGNGLDDGDIYYSDDFGISWTKSEVGSVIEEINSIAQLSTGRVLIGTGFSTGDGDIYHSDDFGLTWVKSEIGSGIERVYSISQLSTGRVLIGAGSGTGDGDIYYSDDISLIDNYKNSYENLASINKKLIGQINRLEARLIALETV